MPPPAPDTTSARLEIHQINVGQGDSVLIINRDLAKVKAAIEVAGRTVPDDPIDYVPYAASTLAAKTKRVSLTGTVKKALLVDGGDDIYGDGLIFYLEDLGVVDVNKIWQPDLMLLLSHYHDDHMAGLRSVFKQRIEPKKKGDKVHFDERFRPGVVYRSMPNSKEDPDTERFRLFSADLSDAAGAKGKKKTKLVLLPPGGVDDGNNPTVISLGDGVSDIPIEVHVVASGQHVRRAGKRPPVRVASVGKKPDQNDRSVVLVLEYGSFRCFLGGDIAGNGGPAGGNEGTNAVSPGTKRYFSQHADVETTLGVELEKLFPQTPDDKLKTKGHKYPSPGYCTVMKANHHGSSSSVDVHLLATLRPSVLLISSGVKSRFHNHPTQQVLDRADRGTTPQWWLRNGTKSIPNTNRRIYLTEVAKKVKGTEFKVDLHRSPILGDIVVRPVDEDLVKIRDARAPGEELRVQVYGNGAQSIIVDLDRTELLDTARKNPPDDIYPIGPFEHTDTH